MTQPVHAARLWLVAALVFTQAGPSFGADAVIHGAGATFPFPVYAKWAADYKRETGVEVRYAPIGSGAGVQQIGRKLVDFGASDAPLSRAELQRLELVQFPAVIGGVVPVVNISGVKSGDLKLSGQILGEIYLGRIGKWNDRAIVALNPGLTLPSSNITVVHRSDSSGTTFLWSEFLSRSNPGWKAAIGTANVLTWPVGVAEVGNEGIASAVQRTRVSIGYVEYAYAIQHKLSLVSVRNREGHFVAPSAFSFESAVSSARWEGVADLEQSLIDQAGAASWPITAATFVLLRAHPEDANQTREVIKFFDWALRRAKGTALDLDYVPIPDSAIDLIDRIWTDQVRPPEGGAIWPVSRSLH
jgi:phosphate transport system substrate-binding protein